MRALLYFALFMLFLIKNACALPASFADIVAKVSPAVVNISTTQKISKQSFKFGMRDLPPPPLDLFDLFEKELDVPREVHSLGSGFIVDADGYIVTNYHVVNEANEIEVMLDGSNKSYKAKIVGKDQKTDIALLKIDADKKLPYIHFGSSDKARVGDWILAIGNPFGLGGTITAGIISAKARHLNSSFGDYIQTDASINRGNSGGPMINAQGEVIGINNAIVTPSGGSVGIGFAIPSATAEHVVQQLKKHGKIERGWLGVLVQYVDDDIAKGLELGGARGALVAEIMVGSPAEKAGMKTGDLIIKYDGNLIGNMNEIPMLVAKTPLNKQVDILIIRDGKQLKLRTVIEKAKEKEIETSSKVKDNIISSKLGIIVADITELHSQQYQIPLGTKGAVITSIKRNSKLRMMGITVGDYITVINKTNINSVNDLTIAIDKLVKAKAKNAVFLFKKGSRSSKFVVLSINQ